MIITKLKGGLGNQLFQYACGKVLSLKRHDSLKLDTQSYSQSNKSRDIKRTYGLKYFKINAPEATLDEIQRIKYPFGIFSKLERLVQAKILKKFYLDYHPEIFEIDKKDIYLDGYFQSQKYFMDIREELLLEISISNPSSLYKEFLFKINQTLLPISIHIRRGDYAIDPIVIKEFGSCSIDYYKRAIKYMTDNYPEATFFVFSDDIEWVKENLHISSPLSYVSRPDLKDFEEICLMSECKHHIIANSSFSWWGAWLNKNNDKTIIAPLKWTNIIPDPHPNLIPKTWIQLPN